jgi:hypothetical protein
MSKRLGTQRPHKIQKDPVHLLSRYDGFFRCGVFLSVGNISEKNQGEAIELNNGLVNKKAGFQAVKEPGNHEISGYIPHLDAGG